MLVLVRTILVSGVDGRTTNYPLDLSYLQIQEQETAQLLYPLNDVITLVFLSHHFLLLPLPLSHPPSPPSRLQGVFIANPSLARVGVQKKSVAFYYEDCQDFREALFEVCHKRVTQLHDKSILARFCVPLNTSHGWWVVCTTTVCRSRDEPMMWSYLSRLIAPMFYLGNSPFKQFLCVCHVKSLLGL